MTEIVVLVFRILLVLALYSFLGWIFYLIYTDLQATNSKIISRRIPKIIITLENESDNPLSFEEAEITIGRDKNCDIEIHDDTVSSLHARLSYHHNQWWVEDLQSTNGTFLNDERVFTSIVMISGDELRLGNARLMVSMKS